MGFFKPTDQGTRASARVSASEDRKPGCQTCSLRLDWKQCKHPRMEATGNLDNGDILVLGEAPGQDEDQRGTQFVGRAGRLLHEYIPKKFDKRLVYQHSVRCRSQDNRTPTAAEVFNCSIYLEEDTEGLPIKAVLGTGAVPLHKYFPEAQIAKIHGTKFPIRMNGRIVWYYPVLHPAYVLHSEAQTRHGETPVAPILASDTQAFFKEVDKWPAPEIKEISPKDVILCHSKEDAEGLLAKMQEPLAVDIETNSLRAYGFNSMILTAAFSDGKTTIAFSVQHPDDPTDWGLELLLHTVRTRRWIAHNAGFELGWFRTFGPGDAYLKYEDTMALGRLYHQRETLLSLEMMSRIHLGVNVKKMSQINTARIIEYPVNEVLRYNGLDALATALVFDILKDKVDKEGYQRILGAIDSTTGMELLGLPVSQEEAQGFKEKWKTAREQTVKDAAQFFEAREFSRDKGVAFNIASPVHVGEALVEYGKLDLPRTPGGSYSTDDKNLSEYRETNPLVNAVLDYREAAKLEATYIDSVLDVPKLYPDGNLHPCFTVMFTKTLRLSSTGPNAQNFPRRKHSEIRRMIKAPPGYIFLAFDYAQLEVRVLAMASRDPVLIDSILRGRDMHGDWRDNLLKLYPEYRYHSARRAGEEDADSIPEKKLLKMMRDTTKNEFVFASFYGSSADACARRMGVPNEIMHQLVEQFWKEFSGVADWIEEQRKEYSKTGNTTSLTGRVRHSTLWGNEPINNPIQTTAADIVTESMNEMTRLSREMADICLHPRINIHDDLVFCVPDDDRLEQYVDIIKDVMVKVRWPFITVPLVVEGRIGNSWDALEEFGVFSGTYVK